MTTPVLNQAVRSQPDMAHPSNIMRLSAWYHRLWKHPQAPVRLRWTPVLVERFWDGISKSRLTELNFSCLGGKRLIAAVAHLLPREGQILDFGAGDGELIRFLCERGQWVSGYEPSEGRNVNLRNALNGVSGFQGTISSYSSTSFDVVLMVEVIEHIVDEQLDDVLRTVTALTKVGGLLIVSTPNNEDLDLNMVYCPVSNMLFHRWQHVRSFTHESLTALLARYGFEEIATHKLGFEQDVYTPYDEIWGTAEDRSNPPAHMIELRANRPTRVGSEASLVYVGRRLSLWQQVDKRFLVSEKVDVVQKKVRSVLASEGGAKVAAKRLLKRIFGSRYESWIRKPLLGVRRILRRVRF